MNKTDKEMVVGLLSKEVGRAVSQWAKKNAIQDSVVAEAYLSTPSCYVDESGVVHFGQLITVDIDIEDDDSDDI